jgi:hypothetical protein
LAALRKKGYRSANRYVVFQTLPHTIGVKQEVWRTLDICHNRRNVAEYEGHLEIDEKLLQELLAAAKIISDLLKK